MPREAGAPAPGQWRARAGSAGGAPGRSAPGATVRDVENRPAATTSATGTSAPGDGSGASAGPVAGSPGERAGRLFEVRAVLPSEHEAAGAVVVAAYRALPGAATSGGYEATLADVARRAAEAEVLVAVERSVSAEPTGPVDSYAGGSRPQAGGRVDNPGPTRVLGCVTYVPDHTCPWAEQVEEGEASIRMLGVDPAAQGRGVGAALVGACVERARSSGAVAVFLHSTPWMRAAHHLYDAAGFVRVPERDWTPAPEVPLLAFRLELR